ncbi:MAG: 4-hydroxy-tetrahydrodipicolinate reductase [Actinobacteria bacterium]|nr:4-hydroxy-tetrahydrodipicolinate reductase [Thermoleophilia bacterium]MCB9010940.1 4-hydroxy-tetrahydrodipicolinate reductase [Actinomycetota bacterium]
MIRVLVAGAGGRMGATVVNAVNAADGMEVVARVDPALPAGDGVFSDVPSGIEATSPDVAVDFTQPHVVFSNLGHYLDRGVHAVVGTTGLSDEQVATVRERARAGEANVLIAPNFAVGAVLMMRFAAEASRHMQKAEIIELHHDRKLDAPSGTALRTAGLMAGDPVVHSVRLPGLVAHQEVILGGLDETLTIRHDSLSRESFMPGVVLAVREVGGRPGLTMGLEPLLFDE